MNKIFKYIKIRKMFCFENMNIFRIKISTFITITNTNSHFDSNRDFSLGLILFIQILTIGYMHMTYQSLLAVLT